MNVAWRTSVSTGHKYEILVKIICAHLRARRKNSSVRSWNESKCYDASQITWHIKQWAYSVYHTWHQHPPHWATKDGLAHSNKLYSAKNAKNYAPHYAFFFYIILSLLQSSAQIFSSIQKGNTRRPIQWLESGPYQVAIYVWTKMPAQELKSESEDIASYSPKLSLSLSLSLLLSSCHLTEYNLSY